MSQHPLQHRATPYLFLSPTLLFYAIFIIFPIGFSLYISFHRWDILTSPWKAPFIGLGNYEAVQKMRLPVTET